MIHDIFYDNLSHYTKKTINGLVDLTFPRTATIALISGGAGWYGYRYGYTFGTWYQVELIYKAWGCDKWSYENLYKCIGANVTAVGIVPETTPYIARYISIGAYCFTSITLNLISLAILKITKKKDESISNTSTDVKITNLNKQLAVQKELTLNKEVHPETPKMEKLKNTSPTLQKSLKVFLKSISILIQVIQSSLSSMVNNISNHKFFKPYNFPVKKV